MDSRAHAIERIFEHEVVVGVRLRPAISRGFSHFLAEIALFDHELTLPPLGSRPTAEFISSLARPAVAGIVSASNHPDCPAEDPKFLSTARAE